MTTLTASAARATLYKLLDQTASSHEPVQITGKRSSAVLISEEDWRSIQETLHLPSVNERDFDPPPRRLEDVEPGSDLDGFICQQADADGVADAIDQQRRDAGGGFDDGVRRLARLGDTQMRRVVRLLRVEPVRFDGGQHVG